MADVSNESDDRKVETVYVSLEGGEDRRLNYELSESASPISTWCNETLPSGEMPQLVIKDEQGGYDLLAVSSNHDDKDGHNRGYLKKLPNAPGKTEMEKLEFEGDLIEVSSNSTGSTSWNATAAGPRLS